MVLRKIELEIILIRDMLQHQRPTDKITIDKLKASTKILQRDPDNVEAFTQEAEASLYRNPKGKIYIPSKHIEGCLVKAGTSERIAGKGKKTYKDIMKAFVEVADEYIVLDPQGYTLHREWVVVNRSRIMRTRPMIAKGTTAKFILNIFDDALPLDILERIIRYAGTYVGIGDWRPKYGLFEVTKFGLVEQ